MSIPSILAKWANMLTDKERANDRPMIVSIASANGTHRANDRNVLQKQKDPVCHLAMHEAN